MLQIGDVIKLRPSYFERELCHPACEWSNRYMHDDQFKNVSLWFDGLKQEGERVKTIFGSSESRVEKIASYHEGKPFEVITNLFSILLPFALEAKEVAIYPYTESDYRQSEADKFLIGTLELFEQEYLKGTFSIGERENNKFAQYKTGFYLMRNEGKWRAS